MRVKRSARSRREVRGRTPAGRALRLVSPAALVLRRRGFAVAVSALAVGAVGAVGAACNAQLEDDTPRVPAETPDPTGAIDPGSDPPDVELLLPDLDGYRTDDTAEPGELTASLDHGDIPYQEVRRRLLLDEDGFGQGEITVVTFAAGSAGGEAYLAHRYGPVPRSPERVGDVEMLRLETDPHPALAWVTPTFVMTFERGGDQSMEWLRQLARATAERIGL